MTVEDGTGLADANSYISLADADGYHAEVGNTEWSDATASDREAALITATRWLDSRYRTRWIGTRGSRAQALDWPRWDAFDADRYQIVGVPREVQHATAEAALFVIQGEDLNAPLERGGAVVREKIGPIDTEYATGAPAGTVYPSVTSLLRGVVHGPGVRITR